MLSALLPYDLSLDEAVLPAVVPEPSEEDLENLPPKLREHEAFFRRLLDEVGPTRLTCSHDTFLRALGIMGDSDRAYRRMILREEYLVGSNPILLPMNWIYRHKSAYQLSPSTELMDQLLASVRSTLGLQRDAPVNLLDSMAGGGCIPIEGLRYGLKVYANELNPVAAMVLKATIEYPARYGRSQLPRLLRYARQVSDSVRNRLLPFFHIEPPEVWWAEESARARQIFKSRTIIKREPSESDSSKNCCLWCRVVPCTKCNLNIPMSLLQKSF